MNISHMEVVMTVGSEQSRVRDGGGRFVPGQSGNPAGKLPGTRNRATLLKAALDSEEGPAMARIIIDKALAGDVVTARFCLDRLEPRPRGRAIAIDLPEGARRRGGSGGRNGIARLMMSRMRWKSPLPPGEGWVRVCATDYPATTSWPSDAL